MPSLFESVGQEVMYKANVALTPPNTRYIKENNKVLSGIGYFRDLYLDNNRLKEKNLFDNSTTDYLRKDKKDLGYSIAQSVLYRAAQNPGRN